MKKRPSVIFIRVLLALLAAGLFAVFVLPPAVRFLRRLRDDPPAWLPGRTEETVLLDDGEDIPVYGGSLSVTVGDGKPRFSKDELREEPGCVFSDLDRLGRCGPAFAVLTPDMMPTEPRGEIGQIRPSGWHTVKYPDLIEDRYLYNRCHLVAYALCGENANEKNLITGTRFFNTEGMLPWEREVIRYLADGGRRVVYRVTPVFAGDDLVCRGVEMEAYSADDGGAGVSFHVFVFNVQPGIVIDYRTGDSREEQRESVSNDN